MGGDADEVLVAAAQAGDRAALDALLRSHHDRIWTLCRRIAGNDADASDATQEALLSIVRGLPKFDGRAKFSTWSYRVASNACLDELRRRKRRPTPSLVDEHDGFIESVMQDDTPQLDDQYCVRDELEQALAQLPEDFRVPVLLRDQGGLDYSEIAAALNLAPGTVRSRISRGRSKLAEILRDGNQAHLSERQKRLT